jgi:tetratricopeptide (TPR) repeat protein
MNDLDLGDRARLAGALEEALACYARATRDYPDMFVAWQNRAAVTLELGRPAEALPHYDRAVLLRPQDKTARVGRAMALLTLGRWVEGWADYAWRLGPPERTATLWNRPRWRGQPGVRVLLYAEQGLGDTVMFARFAAAVRDQGAEPIIACQAALVPLLSGLHPTVPVVALSDRATPVFDAHLPLLDVPGLLGLSGDSPNPAGRYLRADAARVDLWRQRLKTSGQGDGALRVGIAWQGNPHAGIDRGRSYPLAAAAALAELPNVRLIALQRKDGLEQLATLPAGMAVQVLDSSVDAVGGAFMDTAAIMASLDLVITSDTALVHVAGAVGCPTWLALRAVAEWRWGLTESASSWYSSVRVFRQAAPGEWAAVFEAMARALGTGHGLRDR